MHYEGTPTTRAYDVRGAFTQIFSMFLALFSELILLTENDGVFNFSVHDFLSLSKYRTNGNKRVKLDDAIISSSKQNSLKTMAQFNIFALPQVQTTRLQKLQSCSNNTQLESVFHD